MYELLSWRQLQVVGSIAETLRSTTSRRAAHSLLANLAADLIAELCALLFSRVSKLKLSALFSKIRRTLSLSVPSLLLALTQAGGWDCWEHETFGRVREGFRTPCACQPLPEKEPIAIGALV
eukprot:5316201-Pleurochrysis_carterae.AAC.2